MWTGIIGLVAVMIMGAILVSKTQFSVIGEGNELKLYDATVWGNLKCEKSDKSVTISSDLKTNGEKVGFLRQNYGLSVTCGENELVDECFFTISKKSFARDVNVYSCNLETEICKSEFSIRTDSNSQDIVLKEITAAHKKIYIESGTPFLDKGGVTVTKTYFPYSLISTSKGALLTEINPSGCFIPSATKNLIPKNEMSKLTETEKGFVLDVGKPVNFPSFKAASYIRNAYTYNGKLVTCTGEKLFEIEQTELEGGDIVYEESIDSLPDKIQCCPSATIGCSDEFKFTGENPFTEGAKCDKQLDPNYQKNAEDSSEVCQFNCVNGVTIGENCRANECLNCAGICSMDYECVAGTVTPDEAPKCPEGQERVDKKTEYCESMLCDLGLTEKKTSSETFCREPVDNTILYVVIGVLVLVFILLITQPKTPITPTTR